MKFFFFFGMSEYVKHWNMNNQSFNLSYFSHYVPKSLIWDPLTWFLTNMYWMMSRINLSIYRGICINVITSSSMPNCSPFLTIFNAFFFSNDIHSQEWKELYFVQQTWWLGMLSFIFSFCYQQQIHFYTYNSQINKWRGFH